MSRICKGYLLILLTALLGGCKTLPPPTEQPPTTAPAEPLDTAVAQTLAAEGKHLEAANEYLRLAATANPQAADLYRLEAVTLLIEAKELGQARQILASPLAPTAPSPLQYRRNLLLATVALAEQHPEAALSLLAEAPDVDAPAALSAERYRLRALAFSNLGRHLDAARARVERELTLTDQGAISENRRALWYTLSQLTPAERSSIPNLPPTTLSGWVALAELSRTVLTDREAFLEALDRWQARYPGHPASEEMLPALVALSRSHGTPPRQIALLLPEVGSFATAAEAIRDGFLAGWFSDPKPNRPAVTLVNTDRGDIPTLYNEAVKAGADQVIGPLDKQAVTSLARLPRLPVPTLALNYVTPSAAAIPEPQDPLSATGPQVTEGLYQFALSPEGEAREVAERAWADGHRQAAVLFSKGSWGERVAKAFIQAWKRLAGTVVATQAYSSNAEDMSQAIRRLLHIDQSEQRYRLLATTLKRRLHHEARRRQDIDFIFLAAFPKEARQLRPQLRYHHAADVPVYATSHVFSGSNDPAADADIDGIIFGDMPWVLRHDGQVGELQQQLRQLWPRAMAEYSRLYAFGFDAYRLVPYLTELQGQPFVEFPGLTGRLVMDWEQRIRRRLAWAEFRDGVPQTRATTEPQP